jgi:hypothetical protein
MRYSWGVRRGACIFAILMSGCALIFSGEKSASDAAPAKDATPADARMVAPDVAPADAEFIAIDASQVDGGGLCPAGSCGLINCNGFAAWCCAFVTTGILDCDTFCANEGLPCNSAFTGADGCAVGIKANCSETLENPVCLCDPN